MIVYDSPFPPVPLRDLSITERVFEGLALMPPDAPVLTCGIDGHSLSAAGLAADIRALAGGLTAAGHGAGAVVAIMAPNMPEYAVVFHAALYAGGTVTTINPTYTASEVAHQVRDSGAGLLVTVPAFIDTARTAANEVGVPVAVIGDGTEGAIPLADLMGTPLGAQVPVDLDTHVAVLPYSSGTTGLPKGVMLSHRNLVANVEQTLVMLDIRPGERTVAFLPFFHIYGQTVLMNLYPAAGGAIVTLPRFDLEAFLRLTQDHATRWVFCVPPVALALARHPLVDDFDLSAVKAILSGAAPLGAATTDAIAARLGCSAMQGYGMTEMSPVSHFSGLGRVRAGSCGQLVPSTSARIVDPESGEDVARGAEGELWIKGPQVMQGYLNRPDATAETITDDGWLRTGDIASVDDDGYFFIHDRLKELIKVKGFQVPPAEVEAALLEHPAVADAAVLGQPDDEAGEIPVAFVVAAPGTAPDLPTLVAHLEKRLAHYKHPKALHLVESIPKSASGKILRRVLRAGLAPSA